MSRRRKEYRAVTAPVSAAAPIDLGALISRILVGCVAALIVARPLVAGDDPGRVRLTSSGTPLSFNFTVLLVLLAWAGWRVRYDCVRRTIDWVPLVLASLAVAAFVSSRLGDRYARPGLFIAWDWLTLGAGFLLVRRVGGNPAASRGLINILLATAVSIAGLGLWQALADPLGLPSFEVQPPNRTGDLAGDDEFHAELNNPPTVTGKTIGTFDRPATLFAFLLLSFPAALLIAVASWRTGRKGRFAIAVPLILLGGLIAAVIGISLAGVGPGRSAALGILADHPLLGAGPGNLSRESAKCIASPGGAWVGLLAAAGVVSGALLIAAVIAIARASRRPAVADDPQPAATRWELYFRRHRRTADRLRLADGVAAGRVARERKCSNSARRRSGGPCSGSPRSASSEALHSPAKLLSRGLLIGAAAVAALGLAFDSVALPTILFPVAVAVALALNLRPEVAPAGQRLDPAARGHRDRRRAGRGDRVPRHRGGAGLGDGVHRPRRPPGQPPLSGHAPPGRAFPGGPGKGQRPDQGSEHAAEHDRSPAPGRREFRPGQRGPPLGDRPLGTAVVEVSTHD